MPPAPEPVADLVVAVERTVPGWLERCVTATAQRQLGECPSAVADAAHSMVERVGAIVVEAVVDVVVADPEAQRGNPLAVLRSAVRHPTEVLRAAGVPAVRRDAFDEERFPDDVYGLSPATWSDVDPDLHDPGIVWGAWKAATVLARRRGEGP